MSKMTLLSKWKNLESNFDCFVYFENEIYPVKHRVIFHFEIELVTIWPLYSGSEKS